jgi:hypothetical protein
VGTDKDGSVPIARRLTDLRQAHPADLTLQNLITSLSFTLDVCQRLPIFEYEADSEGHDAAASGFRGLASSERDQVKLLLSCIKGHLAAAPLPASSDEVGSR